MDTDIKIRKVIFGGYDKIDTLTKYKKLNEEYINILKVQEELHQSKIKELEETINDLNTKLKNAEQKIKCLQIEELI